MKQELQDRASKKQEEERNNKISTQVIAEKDKKTPKYNERERREQLEKDLQSDKEKVLS